MSTYNAGVIKTMVAEAIAAGGRGTQAKLAKDLGVGAQTVNRWSQGHHAPEIFRWPAVEDFFGWEPGTMARAAGLEIVGSKLEVHGLGEPPLVIDLPEGTEYEPGETLYVVITVKGGTALADQILSNAPWATSDEAREMTLERAAMQIEEGHVIDVKIAGHDAPATVIAVPHHGSHGAVDLPAQLREIDDERMAAKDGARLEDEVRAEVTKQARQAVTRARTKPRSSDET